MFEDPKCRELYLASRTWAPSTYNGEHTCRYVKITFAVRSRWDFLLNFDYANSKKTRQNRKSSYKASLALNERQGEIEITCTMLNSDKNAKPERENRKFLHSWMWTNRFFSRQAPISSSLSCGFLLPFSYGNILLSMWYFFNNFFLFLLE